MAAPTTLAARSLLEALRGVMCQLAEPAVLLRTILEQAVAQTGAQRGLFVEVADAGELSYRVFHGFQPGQLEGESGRFSRHLFNRVIESGQGVLLGSVLDDPACEGLESARALNVASVLCTPILTNGRITALIHLEHRQPYFFTKEHAALVRTLAELADLVLPAAIWSEQNSSLTNIEGRIQKINKAVEPAGEAKPDWEALQLLSAELGKNIAVSIDKVSAEVTKSLK